MENLTTNRWWVDVSYATHIDCKGHTGMMTSLGKGTAMSMSQDRN